MRSLVVVFCLLAVSLAAKDDDKADVGTVIGIDLGTTYSWLVVHFLLLLVVIK